MTEGMVILLPTVSTASAMCLNLKEADETKKKNNQIAVWVFIAKREELIYCSLLDSPQELQVCLTLEGLELDTAPQARPQQGWLVGEDHLPDLLAMLLLVHASPWCVMSPSSSLSVVLPDVPGCKSACREVKNHGREQSFRIRKESREAHPWTFLGYLKAHGQI